MFFLVFSNDFFVSSGFLGFSRPQAGPGANTRTMARLIKELKNNVFLVLSGVAWIHPVFFGFLGHRTSQAGPGAKTRSMASLIKELKTLLFGISLVFFGFLQRFFDFLGRRPGRARREHEVHVQTYKGIEKQNSSCFLLCFFGFPWRFLVFSAAGWAELGRARTQGPWPAL